MELLNDYDCEIRYHPGKANVVADALSRKTHVKAIRICSDCMLVFVKLSIRLPMKEVYPLKFLALTLISSKLNLMVFNTI